MATVWRSVGPFLLFLVLYSIDTSQAHLSDDAYNNYAVYDGDAQETEYLEIRPLKRFRRDDDSYKVEEAEPGTTLKDVKSADPLKNSKGDKIRPKTILKKKIPLLKKETSATKVPSSSSTVPSVETPSDIVSISTTTAGAIPVTTSATTTTISNPMPSNETEANLEENRTGGLTDSQNSTEEETDDTISPPTTINVTAGEGIPLDEVVTPAPDEDDPDSGDDILSPISGFFTENTTVDHHRYYRSYTYTDMQEAQQYWVDLDSIAEEKVITNEMLSASHRRAATVSLTFEFPFYGHMLKNITIATGGFLFTGNFVHTWLAATQYIAPLMANFDTSMSENDSVKYADNGTSFTVQWNNVLLKDHADAGTFTFQATLNKNGDIVFTYKQVPVIVSAIGDAKHPVKVGLSDAYIVDRTIFFVRRKTIYEYHKIDKKNSMIGNWTAIVFKALPTCVSITNCNDCLSQQISFQCQWCNRIKRCSNGLDRHRQEWLQSGCEDLHIQNAEECVEAVVSPTTVDTFGHDASVEPYSKGSSSSAMDATDNSTSGRDVVETGTSVGTVLGVVFLLALVLGSAGWITYAYFFPHSTSGQILIRYRPSTWSWKRGEARYTAAAIHSIHM